MTIIYQPNSERAGGSLSATELIVPRTGDEIAFPTFNTGYRVACVVDAIHASAKAGGAWKIERH